MAKQLSYEDYCTVFGHVTLEEYNEIHAHPLTIDNLADVEELYLVIRKNLKEYKERKDNGG